MADIVASVPEFTIRTSSMLGTMAFIFSAISISLSVGAPKEKEPSAAFITASFTASWACPSTIGPQLFIRSIYLLPSISNRYDPLASFIKMG